MEVLSRRKKTAGKTYCCDYCSGRINAGQKYVYSFIVDYGDHWVHRCHAECDKLSNTLNMFDDIELGDGLTSDDFAEAVLSEYQERYGKRPEKGMTISDIARILHADISYNISKANKANSESSDIL